MKKSLLALALALVMTGTLAACGNMDSDPNANGGSAGNGSVSGSGVNGGTPGQTGYAAPGRTGYAGARTGTGTGRTNPFLEDGQYRANGDGQVYGRSGSAGQDLTQGARDLMRDAGDLADDIGNGIGNAARDITGSGTPSWEPGTSAKY
ncbi:MAG: hypothetical protein HFF50_06620 [Lawsonibacter sp.]|nr:hypothetical protein [Lawsonibacter sp.]